MDMKRLLEISGVDAHVTQEKKLFEGEVCPALKKLMSFCDKQNEPAYGEIEKCAQELCDKLTSHLDRYKK